VPAEPGGLTSALSDLVDRIQDHSQIVCRFECPDPVPLYDNVAATELYRIVQEAVSNALKHAQPNQVLVSLQLQEHFAVLRVEDDGSGIGSPAPEERGLGLRIMQNRAAVIGATLTVLPGEQAGTVVTCLMPQRKTNGKKQKKSKPPRASADRR